MTPADVDAVRLFVDGNEAVAIERLNAGRWTDVTILAELVDGTFVLTTGAHLEVRHA